MLHIVTIKPEYLRNTEILSKIPDNQPDTSILRLMEQYENLWTPYTPNALIGTVEATNKYMAKSIIAQEQKLDPRMLNVHAITASRQKLWLVDLMFEVTVIDPDTETGSRENLTVSGIVMAENSEYARDLAKYHYGTPDEENKEYTLTRTKVTFLNSGSLNKEMTINFILTQQYESTSENP